MFKSIRSRLFLLVLLFPLCIHAQNFGGGPSGIKWRQFNTEKSRVIFPAGLDSQALRISNIISLLDTANLYSLGNRIRKWNIVLHTQTTTSNAYVRLAPVISEFYMMPAQNNFDEGSIRWDDNLIVHENRHMQQLSSFNKGLTKVFSFFLGQEGQLLANGLVIPNHFFEGDAVWQETLVTAQGRGCFPEFYNGIKSLWLENKNYSWMKLRSGSYKDYIPDHYPLGYMLVAYGNATYGEDFWKKVTQDAVRFKGVFYPFNKAIQAYSGKTYKQFRNDAMAFFKAQSFPANSVNNDPKNFITKTEKNNVVDYLLPIYIGDDSILVTKTSYRSVSSFYLLIKGKEKKIRVMNATLDNYYSYSNGKIVYASYQSDPRWGNRDYSVLQLVDINTGKQKQLTYKSKYFSPDINKDATEIIAVGMNPDGTNSLHRLNANTGALISKVPNTANYFFTQTKYTSATEVVSVVRTLDGKTALVKVDLNNGASENITPFGFNVLGFPFVKNDTVYFNCMNGYADKVFAVSLFNKKIKQVTNNNNGIYYPVVNSRGEMLVSAFTAGGSMIMKIDRPSQLWQEIAENDFVQVADIYTPAALKGRGAGTLYKLKDEQRRSTSYKKYFHLFNFHSWRPVFADPEFGYTLYGDNLLGTASTNLTYTYNRNEKSHAIGFYGVYAGWFPVISLGVEGIFNRNIKVIEAITDTTAIIKAVNFNSAKINAGISVPLSFTGGRTNKYFNIGGSYNIEQLYYRGIGKDIFANEPLHYLSSFLSFSNMSRQARQNVNPRWGQSITAGYRYAFNYRDSRKFVGSVALYFPGLSKNHSLVLQAAFQKRDTLPDLFSNTFSYSRGYDALSTRRMYKLAANYQLPVLYPDLGVGNIIFFQRIRANGFFDYTNAHARFFGKLTDKNNRSTGAEIFFDTKIWNALPVTFIVRFSHLLDTNLVDPALKNRWEFILPLGFIPN
ncbi:MAG: hypothetical protein QM737_22855 [Ferruginibacter sp.]